MVVIDRNKENFLFSGGTFLSHENEVENSS